MLRFLLIVVMLGFAFSLLKKMLRYFLKKSLEKAFTPTPLEDEKLIRCTTCQIFIPLSKAIKQNDRYYCCDQHIVR